MNPSSPLKSQHFPSPQSLPAIAAVPGISRENQAFSLQTGTSLGACGQVASQILGDPQLEKIHFTLTIFHPELPITKNPNSSHYLGN